MKIVFQRLSNGSIIVDEEKQAEMGGGLLVFIGFHKNDKDDDVEWVVRKTLSICFWPSEEKGPWRLGVKDINGSIMLVVEPGLIASCDQSSTPSFDDLMPPEQAEIMFGKLVAKFKESYIKERIFNAPFGKKVKLDFLNHGPVTFSIDSFHRRD